MNLLIIALISAAWLILAYRSYGTLLARLFRVDPNAKTPAVEMRDDVDYAPIEPKFLIGQHFSAIAAAGPIVGPILAGVMFGWLPALLWILIGSVFIGGVHDYAALIASIRHKARSIAEIVREHMTRRSYLLFLTFVWITIVYIVVAFTDIVASSFVGRQTLENGVQVTGGGIASSSMMYLALPIIMALLMRYAKLSLGWATVIFLPLVGVSIWAGQYIPLDLAAIFGMNDAAAVKMWDVLLLAYCAVASIVPVWLLLQPRGHIGGYFLFAAMAAGMFGVFFGGGKIQYPAFTSWTATDGSPLFPILFITIACGACSGFHALVSSGTTSKQLKLETHAKPVAYGSMLMEAMVAVVSLCCVMMLSREKAVGMLPNLVYAEGMAGFLKVIHVPVSFGICFALLAFTTFVYDTLDVCTRLGRYILQELTGWQGSAGRVVTTIITAAVPLFFVMNKVTDASGKAIPAWKVFWSLFGASNQLLGALALIGITVWLYRTYHAKWVWFVTGLPTVFMYGMSMWALSKFVMQGISALHAGNRVSVVSWVAAILFVLALLLLVEAIKVFSGGPRKPLEANVPAEVAAEASPGA